MVVTSQNSSNPFRRSALPKATAAHPAETKEHAEVVLQAWHCEQLRK